MTTVRITVPLVPVGVNHYAKHTNTGRHYVPETSRAFKDALAIILAGQFVLSPDAAFSVAITIYLGKGQKGDVDNFPKLVLDGLAQAGAFQMPLKSRKGATVNVRLSDSYVYDLNVRKRRDPENPRTEIEVRAI